MLFRWLGRFSLLVTLVLILIGSRYLLIYGLPESLLGVVYLALATLGHYWLLVTLPLFFLLTPVILLWPNKYLVTGMSVIVTAGLASLLLLDSLVFVENRFHINSLTAQILAPKTWLFGAAYWLIGVVIGFQLAGWIWRRLQTGRAGKQIRWLGLAAALAFIAAQLTHIWADANYYSPVTGLSQYLPGYRGMTAKALLVKYGLVDLKQSRERQLTARLSAQAENRALQYPLTKLHCSPGLQPHNLLVIMVDAWRWDMLNSRVTPGVQNFSSEALVYDQHYSGGNSSRMGAFTFFYSLPSTYFRAVESIQQPALLIDQLQQAGYRLGIFSSAPLYRPVTLDRTAFSEVPDLRLMTEPQSDPPYVRDRKITGEWLRWLDSDAGTRPFFGFLFYDAPTALNSPPDYPVRFEPATDQPMARKFAKYQQSIHFVDSEIQRVLAGLEAKGLLASTIVMITSDHGQEFDENRLGFDDHGSAYSDYQLRVPLVLHWPGHGARRFSHRTSHYDVVPTLMTELLACDNDPQDYSVGNHLFEQQGWQWIVAGSYYNMAIVEPQQVIIAFPNGLHEVRDNSYQLIPSPQLDNGTLTRVMQDSGRFFQ